MSFKETMMTCVKKSFDLGKKFVKAGVTFVKEHPTESMYILFGGIVVGCAVGAAMSKKKYYIPDGLNDEAVDDAEALEAEKKIWDEFYKDTWEKVNEFAKTLKLQPGESYIIEDQMQFADEKDYYTDIDWSMPIVSHMVFNEGIYPPGD